jgi:hypothetical protein
MERGKTPVFYGTPEDDREAYFKSKEITAECAKTLEKSLADRFSNNRIDTDGVWEDMKGYSLERVGVILANTVMRREGDGRFSRETREWARDVKIPYSQGFPYGEFLDVAHSVLVEHIARQFREMERTLNDGMKTGLPESGPLDADGAYWAHFGNIYEDADTKLKKNLAGIDAIVAVRMRVTGYGSDEVREAIERNAPETRRRNLPADEFEKHCSGFDWKKYAANTVDGFAFGPRGTILYEQGLKDRPLYLRVEGRDPANEANAESARREAERSKGRR